METVKFTKEVHNYLVDTAKKRAENAGLKGKKMMQHQHEFFIGGIAAIDAINNNNESSISPTVYIAVIRGELIQKID